MPVLMLILSIAFAQNTRTIPDGYEKNGVLNVSVLSEVQARKLFEQFRLEPNIPFNYPIDGCYARASEMALAAEEQNIQMAKVYAEGFLRVKTGNRTFKAIEWNFHVAPVAFVKANDKIELMVFDPSLFREPVSVETWKRKMLAKGSYSAKIEDFYYGGRYQNRPRSDEQKKYSWQKDDIEDTIETLDYYSWISRAAVYAEGSQWNGFVTNFGQRSTGEIIGRWQKYPSSRKKKDPKIVIPQTPPSEQSQGSK